MKKLKVFIFIVLFLPACTYKGGIDNTLTQKFSWFSYIHGEDIRAVCKDLDAPRMRLVYNGIYQEHRRMYDLFGESRRLDVVIRGKTYLNDLKANDLLAPMKGTKLSYNLTKEEVTTLGNSIVKSIALHPAPDGLFLHSDDFFWTAVVCREGEISFSAFKWPDKGWDEIKFIDELQSVDETISEMPKPRELSVSDRFDLNERYKRFQMQVDENGLFGF